MLLHLSDLHFGTEKIACLNAIRQFCRQHAVEVIAVSGDLTQRATIQQFQDCKAFLDSLKIPYLVVPGNHDLPLYHIWHRMFQPFSRYEAFFGQPEQILETEHFYLVGVNSIRRRHHTKGRLSKKQILCIDTKLAQASSKKLKIVVVHQPFYVPVERPRDVSDCPNLAKKALKRWGKQGLFGLLHGHFHQSGIYDLNKAYQLNLNHAILDIHAGTASSWRLHHGEANGFNVVKDDGSVEHYLFDEKHKKFKLVFVQ